MPLSGSHEDMLNDMPPEKHVVTENTLEKRFWKRERSGHWESFSSGERDHQKRLLLLDSIAHSHFLAWLRRIQELLQVVVRRRKLHG